MINRLVPPIVHLDESEWDILADYISDSMEDFYNGYSLFLDQGTGSIRQRVAELHTAVIELSTRLQKGEIESQSGFAAWLPRHTFIVLSQIQGHAAALLEDLAFDDSPTQSDITAMANSLDSMIDTYTDIKELINTAMDNFRRSNFTLIQGGKSSGHLWRMIQISITGVDVWRRAIVSFDCTMEELHKLIQIGMSWKGNLRFRFYCETPDSVPNGGKEYLHDKLKLCDIDFRGKKELVYEYGSKWNVKIIIMSSYQPAKDEVTRFITGDGVAPPEHIDGPRHFRRILASQPHPSAGANAPDIGSNTENQSPQREFDFVPGVFDLDKLNQDLREVFFED